MKHYKESLYYAKEGEFVLLDGQPYVGPYHVMVNGIPMTGTKHSKDSQTLFPITTRTSATESLTDLTTENTTLNENDTFYDLLPELVNQPPVIVESLAEASTPPIKPSAAAGTTEQACMYLFPDGTVKVHTGVDITLRVKAQQPDVFNVENGILEIIPPNEGIRYEWYFDGELITAPSYYQSLNASRVPNGNTLVFTNMIPQFAGRYSCLAINDIDSADGGSVDFEVLASNFDDRFYTNLVENPNGRGEDGQLSIDGWESLTDNVISKQLTPRTSGLRDKRIAVDPMNQEFHWTKEMLYPRPYQLNPGVLQNNPLNLDKLTSYFTRDIYDYAGRGGTKLATVYQDIDVSDLREQVRGSIYGVDGVTALISFYVGNAIFNYEPARPYITPDQRAKITNYYQGAARLSLENYIKMGPGFVKEVVKVQIEEYDNETRVKSLNRGALPITKLDPWNTRLPLYNNQQYTTQYTSPDYKPGRIDRHLFVADDLFPEQQDRWTYGQYAEFNRIVLDKLNPKTTKIRLIFTIETVGILNFIINEPISDSFAPTKGIYEVVGWQKSWESGVLRSETSGTDEEKPWRVIENDYRNGLKWPESVEQRMPKQSVSRAFATGFNVTLVPTGPLVDSTSDIESMYTINTSPEALVLGPISEEVAPFDPQDQGNRNLDIEFMYSSKDNILGIDMEAYSVTVPNGIPEQVFPGPGLLPFDTDTDTTYIRGFQVKAASQLKSQSTINFAAGTIQESNGSLMPVYIRTSPDSISTPTTEQPIEFVQLTKASSYDIGSVADSAPEFPTEWYTIKDEDRLRLYQNMLITGSQQELTSDYAYWSTPNKPLNIQEYTELWNNPQTTQNAKVFLLPIGGMATAIATWKDTSRFVITLGVHNTNFDKDDVTSLHSIDSYYMDFANGEVTFHKNPNTAGASVLPSFDVLEQATADQIEFLKQNNAGEGAPKIIFNTEEEGALPEGPVKIYSRNAVVTDMVPVSAKVDLDATNPDQSAQTSLPINLLTNSRNQGGLNIPTLEINTGSLDEIDVVEGTNSLLTSPTPAPNQILEYNLDTISSSIAEQIEPLYEQLNQFEKNFFDLYTYTLPHSNPKQSQTLSGDQSPTNKTFIRQTIDESSGILTLGRRLYVLNEIYSQLIKFGSYGTPNTQGTQQISLDTLQARVDIEAGTLETEARIFTTSEEVKLDSSYKVLIYGIRPVPIGAVSVANENLNLTGTPLKGVFEGKDYTIRNIMVKNTGSLSV